MRYECQEKGFEGAYLEFPDTGWTRAHMRDLRTLDESEAWFARLRSRLTEVHLPVVEGEPVTKAEQVTPEMLDRLDLVLYNWFASTIVEAMRDVTQLGNAPWRRLSAGSETSVATKPPTQS